MNNKAFTLVELAIVIVIIGLLVSGVLAGQELIKQAKIRHDIKRLTEIEVAIITFKGKYNFIPGDMPGAHAARFFGYPSDIGGDGNGKLGWDASTLATRGAADNMYFWIHLAGSKLLQVRHTDCSPMLNQPGSRYARFRIDSCSTTLGGTMYAYTGDLYPSLSGASSWYLGNAITIAGFIAPTPSKAAYNVEATRNMDEKMDDGKPTTGKFRGSNGGSITGPAGTVTSCVDENNNYVHDDVEIACRILYEFGL